MRRALIPVLSLLLASGCAVHADRPPDAIQRGCQYLWSQQGEDGGWHSRTYGLLKSGQSLTPFVLDALLQAQSCLPPAGAVDRALAFIKRNTSAAGAVGMADTILSDYPNYSTALAIKAIRRAGRQDWRQRVAPMSAWLRSQQISEEHGWKPDDAAYGAWGMGGEPRVVPNPGHVDLSMTRYVLQALSAAEVAPSDPAWARARVFVEHSQNPDGGFLFSAVVLGANKAGRDTDGRYRSYGTATADGLLALQALGDKPESKRMRSARQWLADHDRPDGAPGFGGDTQRWTLGLRFYYAAASSEAMRAGRPLVSSLESSQQGEGSWRNAEKLVKEDDPLIATAFAVSALARAKLE